MATDERLKSGLILDQLKKQQLDREIVDVEEAKVKLVVFICGENRYAFYGADIREIIPACEISWVPSLPEYIPGLINVRGDIESVIDIRSFLQEKKGGTASPLIALAVRGDFHSGIMIDAMEDVVDIPLSAIHPPLATLNGAVHDLVIGETELGGRMVTLLDIAKLAARIAL